MASKWASTCNDMDGDGMIRDFLFLILFFVLIGVWLTGWLAFHIAGGMIHLILLIAVLSLIMHLFQRRTS
jgi:hypothetical protein